MRNVEGDSGPILIEGVLFFLGDWAVSSKAWIVLRMVDDLSRLSETMEVDGAESMMS